MNFEKVIVIDKAYFLISVKTLEDTASIYEKVSISDKLVITLYGSTLTDVATNNFDKTKYQYSTFSQGNNAISLHEKNYAIYNDTWIRTEIPKDINIESSEQFYCVEYIDSTTVHLYMVESFNTSSTNKSRKIDFKSDTLYSVKLDINTLFNTNGFDDYYIDFITEITRTNKEINDNTIYHERGCTPLYTLNNLEWFSDIREIFYNNSKFNFKFSPINNLKSENKYETDENGEQLFLKVNNGNTIQSLFFDQYLIEFKKYFTSLEAELYEQREPNFDRLLDIKYTLGRTPILINSFMKGTIKGIEQILLLYGSNIGKHFVKVEPSISDLNFVYRITTDIPSSHWYGVIKEIVHPIAWSEQYVYVKLDSDLPNYDTKNIKTFKTDIITKLKERPVIYLDINNDNEIVYSNHFDISNINSMNSGKKFNYKPQEYTFDVGDSVEGTGYYTSSLIDILNDSNNWVITPLFSNGLDYSCEYLLTGVALQYTYTVYKNAASEPYMVFTSYQPKITLKLNEAGSYRIDLTLINNTFQHTITIGTITKS